MRWLVVVLACAALFMGLKAARHWRESNKEAINPDVAWWTAAAFILGTGAIVVALLFLR
jgi:hypothetical protein